MATIERGVFTVRNLEDWRATMLLEETSGHPTAGIEARAKFVVIAKALGRVKETLVEGVTLFDRVRNVGLRAAGPTALSGLRAVVMAAIARPEVSTASVHQSIDEIRRLCRAAGQPALVADHLELDLDATLQPATDYSARARALYRKVVDSGPLMCTQCMRVRLAWRFRKELTREEVAEFTVMAPHCLPERGAHLVAAYLLHQGRVAAADAAYRRAVAAFGAEALPVPLLRTGVAIAVRRKSSRLVNARVAALEAALRDFEYPYIELAARRDLMRHFGDGKVDARVCELQLRTESRR